MTSGTSSFIQGLRTNDNNNKTKKVKNSQVTEVIITELEWLLRPVYTRDLASETRSRVSTPTNTNEGHDDGAKWWNNPIGAWELIVLKNKPIWLANWRHIMPWQANFSTNQGAYSWNRLLQQTPHIKPVWYEGAKLVSKSFFAQHNFSLERGSFAPGACCRSVLREQAPSCVPYMALNSHYNNFHNFQVLICFLKRFDWV